MAKSIFISLLVAYLIFSAVFLRGQSKGEVKKLKDGVVIITSFKGVNENNRGTGIVIGKENIEKKKSKKIFILTAYHVIRDSDHLEVKFYQEQSRTFRIDNIGNNECNFKLDIAIIEAIIKNDLQIDKIFKSFPVLEWGNSSEISQLDLVRNIGHTNGHEWNTVSNEVQNITCQGTKEKLLITNDGIYRGFSGSPLFNEQWKFIGIITSLENAGAIAIKIDAIKKLLDKCRIKENLNTSFAHCSLSITTIPADSDIYIDDKYIGSQLDNIQLIGGRKRSLKIKKPGYKDYKKMISCETGDITAKLEKIEDYICPTPKPRSFESLKNGIEVSPGEVLSVIEIFTYCSNMKYWLCFINNNNLVWPKMNVEGPEFNSSVAVPKTGFNGGKLILACVQKEIDIKFIKWLVCGSDKPLFKPKIFGIILETRINIKSK